MNAAMLKACLRVVGAVAVLSIASRAEADIWVSNGPPGGTVVALALDPTSPSFIHETTNGSIHGRFDFQIN